MEEVYKRAAPKICTAKVSDLSPNKPGAMLKQMFILLPLKRAQNKAQRHQCSTWREAGVSKASPSHRFPWKREVLQVVLHWLAKTLWLCYGTRIFLLRGNTPPLSHYLRLSSICSIEVWWLCSLLPGTLHPPPLVQWAVTRGGFPGKADGLGLLPCPRHLLHPLGWNAEGGRHNQTEGKASKIMLVCRHPGMGWSSWLMFSSLFSG